MIFLQDEKRGSGTLSCHRFRCKVVSAMQFGGGALLVYMWSSHF